MSILSNSLLSNFLVLEDSTIAHALEKIIKNKSGILFIVDFKGHLLGVLSDGDFRSWVLSNELRLQEKVSKIMNKSPFFLYQNSGTDREIPDYVRFVPVVNKVKKIVGLVDRNHQEITIGKSKIAANNKAVVIAEIGNNHNGSYDLAIQLIDAAKASGADIVKFQMRNLSDLYRENITGAEDVGVEYTNNLLRKYNLDEQTLFKCFDYAQSIDLDVICTPFDITSLRHLIDYGIAGIKIASADLTNHPLLKEAARSYLPVILSTGMSTPAEIKSAANVLNENLAQFVPLHCNSTYPAPYKDINLLYMPTLAELTNHGFFGYSGHERGWHIPVAAVALGAKIIEKHFTLDKSMEGSDHKVSLLPHEFKEMVRSIRDIEESLGQSTSKSITQGELINRENLAKSLVASRDIQLGEVVTEEMLECRSPGRGLQPDKKNLILGKSVNRKIVKHDFLYLSDVELKKSQKKDFNFSRRFGVPVRFHDYLNVIEGSNLDLIEFHLTFNDLTADISKLKPIQGIQKIVVHAPELFGQDHILDLAAGDLEYLNQSIQYLNEVVTVTENIKELMQYPSPIEIVVNVGGFSETDFIAMDLRESLYDKVAQNLCKVETSAVQFIVQTMPPYPWHFGGQRYHNLFVNAEEIADFCEKHKRKICFDISHSAMAATYEGRPLLDYVRALGKYSTHLHISDALGLDGEGLQIHEGEIEFSSLADALNKFAPQASFIPEIWQGHKDAGLAFYEALERLEKYAL